MKSTLWTGPLMLVTGQVSKRTAAFMIAGAIPAILVALFLTVPNFLFCTPQHQAYFYFGRDLANSPLSLVPMLVAAICALIALSLPAVPSRRVCVRR
ncbi:hypothetical protein KBB96_04285 [Luteolibacter ambystomatis]|uniref:Uncharacterized protein n=1 Tax=Luteolibacter ambystomatis TaxID=2824561 RepID=A0A975J177_9BACT|nr:hypothetical protein [Luteolibacter ambystomatis]QUE52112.1 hypothetical protein KBB96_04285 [Luteolibacter ambystomatis]